MFTGCIHHLVLMNAVRYAVMKHPFVYENLVAKIRITVTSLLVRTAAAIILSSESLPPTAILVVSEALLIIIFIYFTASVYKVRRNKKTNCCQPSCFRSQGEVTQEQKSLLQNKYRTASNFVVLDCNKYLFCYSDLFQGESPFQYKSYCFVCSDFIASSKLVVQSVDLRFKNKILRVTFI